MKNKKHVYAIAWCPQINVTHYPTKKAARIARRHYLKCGALAGAITRVPLPKVLTPRKRPATVLLSGESF